MIKHLLTAVFLLVCGLLLAGSGPARAAVQAPVGGEIDFITVNDPLDHWSGGTIVVGGQTVIIPKNLLIDLPANRVTLQQLFAEAPAACVANGETGLAKGDLCNTTGAGGFATISANITAAGNIIAGDVLIDKGVEAIAGTITYIDYNDGYFVVNGLPGDPNTGVMVRLNDPTGRHTIQQGLGVAGGPNGSPDPRFTLDPDNYTNRFSTGYPFCIPSTITGVGLRTVGADPTTGAGDPFCPQTNRTVNNGNPVNDSRFFAPIMVGDNITAEGNFEIINGVKFLSAHSINVAVALSTKADLNQPDYLFMEEVFIDAPSFSNQRARALFIGFATLNTDMRIWSRHWDPAANDVHELPLGSIVGCDQVAGGPGNCGNVGFAGGAAGNIFKLRYDVDFLIDPTNKPELYPCAVIGGDPEWAALNVCPGGGTIAENFAILSPTPHEIHVRSRKKTNSEKPGGTPLITQDIQGNDSPNGEYIFPFGINLGGISLPEFVEINLGALQTPFFFTGLPWNLDRRLSPGGCLDTDGDDIPDCETDPVGTFALDPFPFEGTDRNPTSFETTLPVGTYSAPVFTASTLTSVRNRMLSYVTEVQDGVFNFDGNNTVLAWPPADPAFIPITAAPFVAANTPPVITSTAVTTATTGTAYTYQVVATDSPGDTLRYFINGPAGMSISATGLITWTPPAGSEGAVPVTVFVFDQAGLSTTQIFTIQVATGITAPTITSTAVLTATTGTAYSYQVTATDTAGDTFTFTLVAAPAGMSITASGLINWTPAQAQTGAAAISVIVADQTGLTASQNFTITVAAGTINTPPVITSTPVTTATTGAAYSYQVTATDTPGDTLTFTLTSAPAGMSMTASGLISWTPAPAQAGTATVNVVVADQGGLTATQNFTITVAAGVINTAPTITSVAVTTATAGTAYSYQVAGTDTAGDTLVFALPAAPAGMGISAAGLITWTPAAGQVGTANVTVTITDQGGLSATQNFAITVAAAGVNLPPTISSTPVTAATAGTAYSYQLTVADTPGDTFTYALPTAPTGMNVSAGGLISWTPTNAQAGAVSVAAQVTDQGGLSATQSFTIQVTPVVTNTAPAIASTPVTTATAGAIYNYQLVVADTLGDTFTFTLPTAPASMTVSATGLISWTPTNAQAGVNAVTVQVADQGGLSASQGFTIQVTAVINTAPVINSAPVTTASAGIPYSYQLAVVDAPGDTFTFGLTAAPAGMTVSATGLVTWTPSAAQAGLNSVTVQVTDQGGLSATQSFTVNVTVPDTIIIRLAEFRTVRQQWRVSGTAGPSANQALTITYDDGTAAGTLIGTAVVVAGAWTLDIRNATGVLNPTTTGATRIRVTSTLGGTTTALIAIRR